MRLLSTLFAQALKFYKDGDVTTSLGPVLGLPQPRGKCAFPYIQSEFTWLQLDSHRLLFHWASRRHLVWCHPLQLPWQYWQMQLRSQLVEVLLDGGPALLHINNSAKSWSKATKKRVLKILMLKRNLQHRWLQSKPKERLNVQNLYVHSISYFSSIQHLNNHLS